MTQWIYPLLSAATISSRLVGSKAARLSDVARLGFSVPDGFILSTEAFRWFCHVEPLQNQITDLISRSTSVRDTRITDDFRAAAQHAFCQAELQEGVLSTIRSEASLLATKVAVRSSAPEEDNQSASFAGILHTVLRVSIEEIADAVKSCWISVFSPRAIAYCIRARIDLLNFDLAILIQKMLEPSESGVCFTANPVTGSQDEFIVEAVKGTAEKLVTGEVTPWRAIRSKTGNSKPQPSFDEREGLSSSQLETLLEASMEIERHFGSPQDIEFAFIGHSLYILQARPITALIGGVR